jgi:DNA-binding MarR family transcriptional regulator
MTHRSGSGGTLHIGSRTVTIPPELNNPQRRVLQSIAQGNRGRGQIAAATGLHPYAVSNAVKRLVDLGLVRSGDKQNSLELATPLLSSVWEGRA